MELDTIGKRINFARIILGLSQKEVATILGTNFPSKISNWEVDRATPSATSVPALTRALNCTPAWLYFGEGDKPV